MLIRRSYSLFLFSVLILSISGSAFALGSGGLSNVTGTTSKAAGHGYAFTGVADDPSAIWFNPAGLSSQKGFQLMAGVTPIKLDTEHTTPSGQKDDLMSKWTPVPYFYLTSSMAESKWAFGLGVNSPYGLSSEWSENSFARYYATKSELFTYQVNPTVSYAVNDKFSVGGGVDYLNIYHAELNAKVLGALFLQPTDGDSKVSGDGDGWGYNLGMKYQATEKHSFGISYRSQINVAVDGKLELSNLGPASFSEDITTDFKFPQNVTLGYGFKPSDRWTWFLDYEWANWAVVKETQISGSALSSTIPRHWRNSNNIGGGADWKMTQKVDLRFGLLFYESVVPESTYEATLPESSRTVLTTGAGWHLGENTLLNFAYNALFFNTKHIDNNQETAIYSQDGTYKTFSQAISLGITQKWGGK